MWWSRLPATRFFVRWASRQRRWCDPAVLFVGIDHGHGRTSEGQDRVASETTLLPPVGWSRGTRANLSSAPTPSPIPAAGLVAAAACLDALAHGGRWLIDVALAGVAAHLAGPTLPVPASITPAQPAVPPLSDVAPEFGANTAAALASVGNW